jgi:transposase-like protein
MRKQADWQRATAAGKFWTAADAREALAACARSGETTVAFARRHGLSAKRLYWWRQRLRKERNVEGVEARFIPVTVRPGKIERGAAGAQTNGCVAAVVDGELRVEVGDASAVSAAWIAELLRLVREGGA